MNYEYTFSRIGPKMHHFIVPFRTKVSSKKSLVLSIPSQNHSTFVVEG